MNRINQSEVLHEMKALRTVQTFLKENINDHRREQDAIILKLTTNLFTRYDNLLDKIWQFVPEGGENDC